MSFDIFTMYKGKETWIESFTASSMKEAKEYAKTRYSGNVIVKKNK